MIHLEEGLSRSERQKNYFFSFIGRWTLDAKGKIGRFCTLKRRFSTLRAPFSSIKVTSPDEKLHFLHFALLHSLYVCKIVVQAVDVCAVLTHYYTCTLFIYTYIIYIPYNMYI